MAERLQKILAGSGYGSRRACEALIAAGRIRVNGEVAVLGQRADPGHDKITIDGRPLAAAEKLVYIALYKPRNIISSADDDVGRKTVRDLVPVPGRLYPVGRLDWDSEGLILMTNDGELTNKLTHPRYGRPKEYRVLVARRPAADQIEAWGRGVVLEDGYKTRPADVRYESSSGRGAWVRVTMGEGRNRQIRDVAATLGLPVVRILRVGLGSLRLGNMKPGQWRYLNQREVEELKGKGSARALPRPRTRGRSGAKAGVSPRTRG